MCVGNLKDRVKSHTLFFHVHVQEIKYIVGCDDIKRHISLVGQYVGMYTILEVMPQSQTLAI